MVGIVGVAILDTPQETNQARLINLVPGVDSNSGVGFEIDVNFEYCDQFENLCEMLMQCHVCSKPPSWEPSTLSLN